MHSVDKNLQHTIDGLKRWIDDFVSVGFQIGLLLTIVVCAASAMSGQSVPTSTFEVSKPLGMGTLNYKAVSLPKPEYPEALRNTSVAGTAKVEVLVDEAGMVVSAETVDGPENSELRRRSEEAARKAVFDPFLLDGKPVKVSGRLFYYFGGNGNQNRMKVFGFATFLGVLRYFADDPTQIRLGFGAEQVFSGEAAIFADFKDEILGLKSIWEYPAGKRTVKVDAAISTLRARLSESDRWQVDAGEEFATVYGWYLVAGDYAMGGRAKPPKIRWNVRLSSSLAKLDGLSRTAPDDLPADILQKVKNLCALRGKRIFSTVKTYKEFAVRTRALMDSISKN